jgi:hypothetical protein
MISNVWTGAPTNVGWDDQFRGGLFDRHHLLKEGHIHIDLDQVDDVVY